jgi:predicted O-methyltransferase YrrM
MEIGVADGENARGMLEAACEGWPAKEVEYYGFDVFRWTSMGEVQRKLAATGCRIHLVRGDSMMTLPAMVEQLPVMDLIFIDGGHAYPTVQSDWVQSQRLMHAGTGVFFHNADWMGPAQVVDAIPRDVYTVQILNPASDYLTALVTKQDDVEPSADSNAR